MNLDIFDLTEDQKDFVKDEAMHKMLVGLRQTGKSYAGAVCCALEVGKPRQSGLVISPYSRNTIEMMQYVCSLAKIHYSVVDSNVMRFFISGSEIKFMQGALTEGIVYSQGHLDFIWLDEYMLPKETLMLLQDKKIFVTRESFLSTHSIRNRSAIDRLVR